MMKYIKALLLTAVLTFSTVSATAATVTIDTDHLTKEQIELLTTKPKQEVSTSSMIDKAKETVDTINSIDTSSWAEKGTEAGKAFINFSKELGMGAVDFATSGTGMLITLGLLAYFFGYKVVAISFALFLSLMAYKFTKKLFGKTEKVVVSEKTDKNGETTKKYKYITKFHFEDKRDDDSTMGTFLVFVFLNVPSLFIIGFSVL